MKQEVFVCALTVFLVAASGTASGGNIDYISTRSTNYIRNFSRNAATDAADIISFNPAGLTRMDEGLYFQINNQFVLKTYRITGYAPTGGDAVEFESTKPDLLLPSFYTVYNSGDVVWFGAFTVPAGEGSVDFENGINEMPWIETGYQQTVTGNPDLVASMTDGRFETSSIYLAGTMGFAYKISDVLSTSVAGRCINSKKTYDAEADFIIIDCSTMQTVDTSHRELDAEKTADGFGMIFGLNISPSDVLNIGVRFETATRLEFETETEVNDWPVTSDLLSFNDGYLQRRDLPAVLGIGLSYRLTPLLTVSAGGNYYFTENADNGSDDGLDDYKDGWETTIGLDYEFSPRFNGSIGYQYTDVGGNEITYNDFEFNLNAHFLGLGGCYSLSEKLDLSLAVARLLFVDGTHSWIFRPYDPTEYHKDNWYFSLGMQCKVF